jgi:hypothetical protein
MAWRTAANVSAMPMASWNQIVLQAVDLDKIGRFWAGALNYSWTADPSGQFGTLRGTTAQPALWINRVDEPKAVKNRVHLDIYTQALADLEQLGAMVMLPEGGDRRWTIMADPEDGEFCAFLRPGPPEPRLHGLVVDCSDHVALAGFWADVLGARMVTDPSGYSTVDQIPGVGFTFDFTPVPEPKRGPNRVHWDLTAASVDPMLARGARLERAPDDEIYWHVLTDPAGNEFCVLPPRP